MDEKSFKPSDTHDIVLFDGVCNLCNHAVNFIIDRDPEGRFLFSSLQSSRGQQLLQKHGLSTLHMSSLVLIRADKIHIKSSGALEIARYLSGFWPVFYIFKIIPYPLRDFIYNLVAQNRYRLFGKRESCRYPTEELKTRFINN